MATIPASTYMSDNSRTEGEMKTALEALRDCVAQSVGGAAESALIIASGSVTPTVAVTSLDTESGAATDDLTNVDATNMPAGRMLFLRAAAAGRVITVKHMAGGTGQISTLSGADFVLNNTPGYAAFVYVGTTWLEVFRGFNPTFTAVSSLNGVSNPNGTITILPANAITVTADNTNKTVVIGETHSARQDNPHAVTAAQVGASIAQWNANKIQGVPVSAVAPQANQTLIYNATTKQYEPASPDAGTVVSDLGLQYAVMYDLRNNVILNASDPGLTVTRTSRGVIITFPTPFSDALYYIAASAEMSEPTPSEQPGRASVEVDHNGRTASSLQINVWELYAPTGTSNWNDLRVSTGVVTVMVWRP